MVLIQTPALLFLSTLIYITKREFIQFISFFRSILWPDSPKKITCEMPNVVISSLFLFWDLVQVYLSNPHYVGLLFSYLVTLAFEPVVSENRKVQQVDTTVTVEVTTKFLP